MAGDWRPYKAQASQVTLGIRNQLQNGAFVDFETQRGPFKASPVDHVIKLSEHQEVDVTFFVADCPEELKEPFRKVCWLSLLVQLFSPLAVQDEQAIDSWALYASYHHLLKFFRSGQPVPPTNTFEDWCSQMTAAVYYKEFKAARE